MILLTHEPGFLGIAGLLGEIFNFLFEFVYSLSGESKVGLIGITIILFTVVVKLLMLPLTIKQTKFSKLSNIMGPELQAIQKKYQGKNDQQSIMKMQEETKRVQEKYGASPAGGCLQILIQMPILLALFKVIQKIPAYVDRVKALFIGMLDGPNGLMAQENFVSTMTENFGTHFGDYTTIDSTIDALNNFTSQQWEQLEGLFNNCAPLIANTKEQIFEIYEFCGINLAVPPVLASIAILIPVLNYFSQWLSMKIANSSSNKNDNGDNPAAQSMKTMTTIMPFMSAFIAISAPSGLGLYWICTAVVQIIQQLLLNAYFNKIDMEELVRKNIEKANEKRKKKGLPPNTISSKANMNTKQIERNEKIQNMQNKLEETRKKNLEMVQEIKNSASNVNAPKKSIREKANMVAQYDEKNRKK